MMEMREGKLSVGNSFVCEQLSRRQKAGKLECSKNIKQVAAFSKNCLLLLPNRPSWLYGYSGVTSSIMLILNLKARLQHEYKDLGPFSR